MVENGFEQLFQKQVVSQNKWMSKNDQLSNLAALALSASLNNPLPSTGRLSKTVLKTKSLASLPAPSSQLSLCGWTVPCWCP